MLERLAQQLRLQWQPKGAILCEEGAPDRDAIYLVEGALEPVTRGSALARLLQGGTPEAAHPVRPGIAAPVHSARPLAGQNHPPGQPQARPAGGVRVANYAGHHDRAGWPGRHSVDAPLTATLAASPVFGSLPRRRVLRLLERMWPMPVKSGQVVLRQGQPCDGDYIVREGRFVVSPKDGQGKVHVLGALGRGASFGADALANGVPSCHTVVAIGPGTCMCLARAHFEAFWEAGE